MWIRAGGMSPLGAGTLNRPTRKVVTQQREVMIDSRRACALGIVNPGRSVTVCAHAQYIRQRYRRGRETCGDVVIAEEAHPEDNPERKRECNPLPVEFPEPDEHERMLEHRPGALRDGSHGSDASMHPRRTRRVRTAYRNRHRSDERASGTVRIGRVFGRGRQ